MFTASISSRSAPVAFAAQSFAVHRRVEDPVARTRRHGQVFIAAARHTKSRGTGCRPISIASARSRFTIDAELPRSTR
jgi:hypothetical protein